MKKIVLLIGLAAAFTVAAQNTPAVNQATTTQQQRETDKVLSDVKPGDGLPSLYSEEDSDVGPQSILRKKKPTWFRARIDAQAFYTDNMLFQERDEQSAGVAVTSLEAALTAPPCITRFASYRAEVGYRHQFFNYFGQDDIVGQSVGGPGSPGPSFEAEDFDFDSSTVFASVLAQTKHYQFRVGFDYARLLGFEPLRNHDYEEFYREYVPRWSVQRNFRVCDKSLFSLVYLGSYHFADEDPPVIGANFGGAVPSFSDDRSERWEHTGIAAYSVALPCHFVAQPYYRFQYTDLVNADDQTYLHTAGFALGWFPCENFSVRGFVGYNWQESANNSAAEYEKLDAGGGVNVTLRF